jgi:hypothetical protein
VDQPLPNRKTASASQDGKNATEVAGFSVASCSHFKATKISLNFKVSNSISNSNSKNNKNIKNSSNSKNNKNIAKIQ